MTCGVITAPATQHRDVSASSERPRPPSPRRSTRERPEQHGQAQVQRARPRAQSRRRARQHRHDRPRRDQDPAQDPRPASAATAGTPTSTPPMTSPNPSPASATVRTPGRASAPIMPAGPLAGTRARRVRTARAQREPGRADDRRDQPTTSSPVPGHGSRDQQRRQRRPEDEEHLHADRLVVVRGGAPRAGRHQPAPQRAGRPGQRGLDAPDDRPRHDQQGQRGVDLDGGDQRGPAAAANSTRDDQQRPGRARSGRSSGPARPSRRDPTSKPADTSPATANEPVAPCT